MSHGQEGLLVPPKDEEALEAALETLIKDPPLREVMGNKGRLKAPLYDWGKVTADVLDYYDLVYKNHGFSARSTGSLSSNEETTAYP